MCKVFLIGDTHLGLGWPNKYNNWLNVHKNYFSDFLFPLLRNNVKEGDIIVHLGDLFDNRNVIPVDMLNYAQEIVSEISQIAPFHIIIGNHDLWTKSYSEINTINIFKYIPNVFVYNRPTKISYNNCNILLMPYIENKKEQIEIIKENRDCEYLFCHSDLNGAKMHLTSVAHKNSDKIDVEEFSNFKRVYSAHIHIVQESKNFIFVGSIFQMDRNDYNNQKGIFILDTDNHTHQFIPNMISPVFRKVYLMTEDDISKLDDIDTSRDYVDLFISNTLLSTSRKTRRKIETSLEKGNFSSIEYINDLVVESLENKEKQNTLASDEKTSKVDYSVDFIEIVRTHIESMEFSTEKIKNGVLEEYSKVEEIYQTEYKINEE
jgi:DNA repair exonuclease SbcCD nuclease subunit